MTTGLRMTQTACFILVLSIRSRNASSDGLLWTWTLKEQVMQSKCCRSAEIILGSALNTLHSSLVRACARLARDVADTKNSLPSLFVSCLCICSIWLWLHLWTLPKACNIHESAKLDWKSPEKRLTHESFSISCFQLGWNQHKNSYNSIWLLHI